jgi:exopolyphosphatase/guanosine-5'-triphosphate,3'-diphosphate pyrophosphatase
MTGSKVGTVIDASARARRALLTTPSPVAHDMLAERPATILRVRVAVIDVGSNTIRMLVAAATGAGLCKLHERRARVGLGAEVELEGRLTPAKIEEAAASVAAFCAEARALGCAEIVVAVASPGRQAANAAELLACLTSESGVPVQLLSPEEEARLAWTGALIGGEVHEGSMLVCDVGGGSTQLAFGTIEDGPVWLRSLDVGSLRLATRLLADDPPSRKALARARTQVARELDRLFVPVPVRALAVGGSARAACRIAGRKLGREELAGALRVLRKRPRAKVAAEFGIDPARSRTVAAGIVILAELQRRLGIPLEVEPTGLREGLALTLLAQPLAA